MRRVALSHLSMVSRGRRFYQLNFHWYYLLHPITAKDKPCKTLLRLINSVQTPEFPAGLWIFIPESPFYTSAALPTERKLRTTLLTISTLTLCTSAIVSPRKQAQPSTYVTPIERILPRFFRVDGICRTSCTLWLCEALQIFLRLFREFDVVSH